MSDLPSTPCRRAANALRPNPFRLPGSVLLVASLAFASITLAGEDVPPAGLIGSSEPGWPQFRGPRRDGVCDERGLLPVWPEGGPKLLWKATDLGLGYSSPIVSGGRIFITGDVREELRVFALDLHGRPLWQAVNGASWKGQFPAARASATFSAGRIYHENAHGRLACLDADTGREAWAVNLLERFGGRNITWGLSECVLVDDRNVYATAGGREALLVAIEKATGELRWKSPPLLDTEGGGRVENAAYASPILIRFSGRRLLIGCSLRHLLCTDADTGKIQWTYRMPTANSVLAMMPVPVGNAVFMTAPYGKGGHLLQLVPPERPDAPVGVREVWSTHLDTLQGCAVLFDGRIYGAFYPDRKGWAVLDAATGRTLYETAEFTAGAALVADGRLYVLCQDGWMFLLQPADRSLQVQGRFRLAEARSRDAWAHPVIHDGRLYLRYHGTLFCYDIKAR